MTVLTTIMMTEKPEEKGVARRKAPVIISVAAWDKFNKFVLLVNISRNVLCTFEQK